MKQLTINPSNKPYYSEDFIKGFECGTQRQLEADLADRPQGEWIDWLGKGNEWECSVCRCSIESHGSIAYNFCPMCGAMMKGGRNGGPYKEK